MSIAILNCTTISSSYGCLSSVLPLYESCTGSLLGAQERVNLPYIYICTLINLAYTFWGLTNLEVCRHWEGFICAVTAVFIMNHMQCVQLCHTLAVRSALKLSFCTVGQTQSWIRHDHFCPIRPTLGNDLWHLCFASIVQLECSHVSVFPVLLTPQPHQLPQVLWDEMISPFLPLPWNPSRIVVSNLSTYTISD